MKFWQTIKLEYPIHYDFAIYKSVVETNFFQSVVTLFSLWGLTFGLYSFDTMPKVWINLVFSILLIGTFLVHFYVIKFSLRRIQSAVGIDSSAGAKDKGQSLQVYKPVPNSNSGHSLLHAENRTLLQKIAQLQTENESLRNIRRSEAIGGGEIVDLDL